MNIYHRYHNVKKTYVREHPILIIHTENYTSKYIISLIIKWLCMNNDNISLYEKLYVYTQNILTLGTILQINCIRTFNKHYNIIYIYIYIYIYSQQPLRGRRFTPLLCLSYVSLWMFKATLPFFRSLLIKTWQKRWLQTLHFSWQIIIF